MEELPFHKRVPARLRGLMIVGVGLALSWWFIWRPLTALERGDTEVWVSSTGIGAGAVITILGAAMVLIGPGFERLMEAGKPDAKNITPQSLAVIVPIAWLAAAAYFLVRNRLEQLGFVF